MRTSPILLIALSVALPTAGLAADDCPLQPPPLHIVQIGYGDGDTEAQALQRARENARQLMTGQLCSGYSLSRCDDVQRDVLDWKDNVTPVRRGLSQKFSACALVAVEKIVLDQLQLDSEAYERAQGALAAAAAERAGGAPLFLSEVVWADSGASAGSVGALILSGLRKGLSGLPEPVALTTLAGAETPSVVVALVLAGDRLEVSASVRRGVSESPLTGFSVALDTLGLTAAELSQAASASPRRDIPALGTVMIDGVPTEEVHWLSGCYEDSLPQAGSAGEQAALYLMEARSLCEQYERFVLSTEQYSRRMAELSERLWGADAAVPELSMEVRAATTTGEALSSGSVVHEGDRFTLDVVVNQDAYVYLLYENSAGEQVVVDARGTLARADQSSRFPEKSAFRVDEHSGRAELVHVIASPDPLPMAGPPEQAVAQAAQQYRKMRGLSIVPDVVSPEAVDSAWYGDTAETVSGYGGLVYTLLLDHQ